MVGRPKSITTSIVIEYMKAFPNSPKLTLAKAIYKEYPKLFKSADAIRILINYYSGCNGENSRAHIHETSLVKKDNFGMPMSEAVEQHPYIVPNANNKALIISDIHLPYHDGKALQSALLYGLRHDVDTIIINGDLFDFYQISRFDKNPANRNVAYEIECAKIFFERLRELFPTQLIIFYYGNHDHRYNKWLYQKAPELLGIKEIELPYILKLTELNVKWLDNDRGIVFGDLNIRHGHEFFGSGGVHPARTYYLKAKANILVSHVHRTSFFQTNDVKRKIHGGWSIGCLSELSPDYNKNSDYNHGFAIVTKEKNGSFIVDNKMILNGKVL